MLVNGISFERTKMVFFCSRNWEPWMSSAHTECRAMCFGLIFVGEKLASMSCLPAEMMRGESLLLFWFLLRSRLVFVYKHCDGFVVRNGWKFLTRNYHRQIDIEMRARAFVMAIWRNLPVWDLFRKQHAHFRFSKRSALGVLSFWPICFRVGAMLRFITFFLHIFGSGGCLGVDYIIHMHQALTFDGSLWNVICIFAKVFFLRKNRGDKIEMLVTRIEGIASSCFEREFCLIFSRRN